MVRRVCPNCCGPADASPEEIAIFEHEMQASRRQFNYGRGCNFCANTGFRGRIGVFEVLTMSENLQNLVTSNAGPGAIKKQAAEEGTTSLLRDGLEKAQRGITTPNEVIRTLYSVS
jgi:general secretion pathway protein E